MMKAKVFKYKEGQAIALPDAYEFTTEEIVIEKIGPIVILIPKTNDWQNFFEATHMFSDDFMADYLPN